MCKCSSPCGCDSGIALPFLQGDPGNNGVFGGFSAMWKIDTMSVFNDPDPGYIRFNNSDLSLVTEIYVNIENSHGIDHTLFLASFNPNLGHIRIFKEFNSNVFWYGELINVQTISATVVRLTVNTILSANTNQLQLNDNIVLTYTQKGDTGSQGAPGAVSGGVIDILYDLPTSTTGAVNQLEAEIEVPLNLLSDDNDILEFSLSFEYEVTDQSDQIDFVLSYGELGYIIDSSERIIDNSNVWVPGDAFVNIEGKIYRKSLNESHIKGHCLVHRSLYDVDQSEMIGVSPLLGFNYIHNTINHSNINKLQLVTLTGDPGQLKLHDFMVKYTKTI